MAYLNYRLQHRSDCAEDSSGSLGLVPLAVLAWPQRDLSLWSIQLTWSQPGLDWDKKSALAFFGPGGPPPPPYNIYKYMIYTTIQKFLNSKIFF